MGVCSDKVDVAISQFIDAPRDRRSAGKLMAGGGEVTARSRSASRGVVGSVAPSSRRGDRGITCAAVLAVGGRLLFVVATAGTSSVTGFRFLDGRL
jgi:hypothetical protein